MPPSPTITALRMKPEDDNTSGTNGGSDKTPFLTREDPDRDGGRRLTLYARSPKGLRVRDERTRRLARRVIKAFPWLTVADRDMVSAFCQVKLLADECFAKIRAEGITRSNGQPHYLLTEFRSLIRVEADLAGRLGLSPRDRAAMQANSTGAALDRIDLKRVDRILRARRGNGDGDDAPVTETNGEPDDTDDLGSDRERAD